MATLESGEKVPVKDLRRGSKVLAMDSDGRAAFSDFVTFLDKNSQVESLFQVIETVDPPRRLSLTPTHLIFVADNFTVPARQFQAVFAGSVRPGQYILVSGVLGLLPAKVSSVRTQVDTGVFAPLTQQGTIVVDEVVVSCFALVQKQRLAQMVFWPLRVFYGLQGIWKSESFQQAGVHWYSQALYRLGRFILREEEFHPQGILQMES